MPQVIHPVPLSTIGPAWTAGDVPVPDTGFHEAFVVRLSGFRVAPQVTSPTFLELFLFWIVDTGCVPPFRVDGRWVRVGEDEDAVCCIPSAYTLYKTWRRAVSFVLRSGNLETGAPVSSATSAVGLGARFAVPGLSWRPRVPIGVRRDLAFQFISLRSLVSLRLPPLWWTL